MNKKALLKNETVQLIIAVICILFLIALLYSIYATNKISRELKQAKADLERISDTITELESSDDEMRSVEILNPRGFWFLSSWSAGDIPQKCVDRGWTKCMCICNNKLTPGRKAYQSIDCNENSDCIETDYKVEGIYRRWGGLFGEKEKTNFLDIKNLPMYISIQKINKKISQNPEIFNPAQESLDDIITNINQLKAGEKKDIKISYPADWVLSSWVYDEINYPSICKDNKWENCLCMCDVTKRIQKSENPAVERDEITSFLSYDSCLENAVCANNDFAVRNSYITETGESVAGKLLWYPRAVIESPSITLTLDKDNKKILTTRVIK